MFGRIDSGIRGWAAELLLMDEIRFFLAFT